MSQDQPGRWVVAICLVLNGATVTALCVGWKLEDIVLDRAKYLLGCAAAAAILCLVQCFVICVHTTGQSFNNTWKVVVSCTTGEAALLSTFIALLYLEHSVK